jgi:transcriptional regulator of acetoin/glycerol metabolism
MLAHDWPGNVRELRLNEHHTIRLGGPGEGSDASDRPDSPIDFRQTFYAAKAQALAEFERAYLSQLMARTSGNISLAARVAGTDRGSLQKLVKKHGILGDRFKTVPPPARRLPRPRLVR